MSSDDTKRMADAQEGYVREMDEQNAILDQRMQEFIESGPTMKQQCYYDAYMALVQRWIAPEEGDFLSGWLVEAHKNGTLDADLGVIHATAIKVAMNCKPEQVGDE